MFQKSYANIHLATSPKRSGENTLSEFSQSIMVQRQIRLLLEDKWNNVYLPSKSKAQHFILSFNMKSPPVIILNRTNKS